MAYLLGVQFGLAATGTGAGRFKNCPGLLPNQVALELGQRRGDVELQLACRAPCLDLLDQALEMHAIFSAHVVLDRRLAPAVTNDLARPSAQKRA